MRFCVLVAAVLGAPAVAPVVAAAQFVVDSTGDEPDASALDGLCLTSRGTCTLRAAIQQANAAGAASIGFNIPGAGPHTITPATALPIVTASVTINGYTQPGAVPNTNPADPVAGPPLGSNAVLRIVLDGGDLIAAGLRFQGGSSTVRGLVVNNFRGDKLVFTNGANHVVAGNFIGTDVTGMIDATAVGDGIQITNAPNSVIGGVLPADRNVIAGNPSNVSAIFGNLPDSVPAMLRVQGNLIGVNAAGNAALNNGSGNGVSISGGAADPNHVPDHIVIGGGDGDDGAVDDLVQARNVIAGHAINLDVANARESRISGNFIGTDVTGEIALDTPPFGGFGIQVHGIMAGTLVGGWSGSSPVGAGNVVAGVGIGIQIAGPAGGAGATDGVTVQGNVLGASATGQPLGLGNIGIDLISVANVLVGGPTFPLDTNVVAHTGTAASHPGFRISTSSDVTIQRNIITANAGRGIQVDAASRRIRITQNHIWGNGLIGIDLQSSGQLTTFVTPNDGGDGDTGSNELQNFPVLTGATGTLANPGTTVTGTLNSRPSSPFTLEFFASFDANKDPSGFGEGEFAWEAFSVTTDASGNASFSVVIAPNLPVFPGTVITATATDAAGNTSEFSNWIPVTIQNSAPVANAGADFSVDEGVLAALNGTASSDADGNALTYQWTQIAGAAVTLANPDTATPTFTAPQLTSGSTTLTFQLIVNDSLVDSAPDVVNVTVVNQNQAPVAMVGPPQTVNEGSTVTLDGSASFDPDTDPITYRWNQVSGPPVLPPNTMAVEPTFTAPPVTTGSVLLEFELVVNDGFVDSAPARAEVTVVNVNQPPVAGAGPDQTVDEGSLVTLDGTASFDPDGQSIVSYTWTPAPGSQGSVLTGATPSFTAPQVASGTLTLRYTLVVSDGQLSSAGDEVVITIRDVTAPPTCTVARAVPAVLWPANGGLERVDVAGVVDPLGNPVQITVLGVTQDEPVSGLDRHDVSPDAVIQPGHVLLRRERDKQGNGRFYQVDFSATDAVGASCTGSVTVAAPHKRHTPAVDDGLRFDSTQP